LIVEREKFEDFFLRSTTAFDMLKIMNEHVKKLKKLPEMV